MPRDLTGPKCDKARRLAGLQGVDSLPVSLRAGDVPPPDGYAVQTALGSLADDEAILESLNRRRKKAGIPMYKRSDMYFVTMEAGSTDRGEGPASGHFLYLGTSTLRNIAAIANGRGFALMNSHRVGGLSSEAELAYGKVRSGRWERLSSPDRTFDRLLLKGYMVKGLYPNGKMGPSTDDIMAGIEAETNEDVSLGLSGGRAVCDLCGVEYGQATGETDEEGRKLTCQHIPGSRYRMTKAQVKAQEGRGVPGGRNTYTLEDASVREVSAVYKGAVPGAGFTRALSAARAGQLTDADLAELADSYAGIALSRDFQPRRIAVAFPRNLITWFNAAQAADTPEEALGMAKEYGINLSAQSPAPEPAPAGHDEEKTSLAAQVKALTAQLAQRDEAEAKDFAAGLVERLSLSPTERQADFSDLYLALAEDDRTHPRPDGKSRLALLKAGVAAIPDRPATGQPTSGASLRAAGLKVLGGAAGTSPALVVSEDGDSADLDDKSDPAYQAGFRAAGGR